MTYSRLQVPQGGSLPRWLMWVQDAITKVLFGVSMLASVYLAVLLAWEVVARYWLESPSSWIPDTASFSFALITFLAAPMLAASNAHAHMDMVVKALPKKLATWLVRLTMLLACVVCLVAAWFGWVELLRLYARGVMMVTVTPIPKWWLMAVIVYALLNSGLYYLRHFLCSFCAQADSSTAAEVK